MTRPTMLRMLARDDAEPSRPAANQNLPWKRVPFGAHAGQQPPKPDFVAPGFKTGTVGVLGGRGASSKTFLAVQLAISIALGHDVFHLFDGKALPAGKVTYISLEDTSDTLAERQHQMAQALWAIYSAGHRWFWPGSFEELLARIDANVDFFDAYGSGMALVELTNGRPRRNDVAVNAVTEVAGGARLVIFDTMNRLASAGGLDENSSSHMGFLMSTFEQIAARTGGSVLVLHHLNKPVRGADSSPDQNAVRGSSVIVDNARWVMTTRVMEDDEVRQRFGADAVDSNSRCWVCRDVTKQNFGTPIPAKWLRRSDGGVLIGTTADNVPAVARRPVAKKSAATAGKAKGKSLPLDASDDDEVILMTERTARRHQRIKNGR